MRFAGGRFLRRRKAPSLEARPLSSFTIRNYDVRRVAEAFLRIAGFDGYLDCKAMRSEWPNCNAGEKSVDAQIPATKSPYEAARIMVR